MRINESEANFYINSIETAALDPFIPTVYLPTVHRSSLILTTCATMKLSLFLIFIVLLYSTLLETVAGQRSNGFPTYDDHPSPFRFNRPIATRKPRRKFFPAPPAIVG
uniref:Uncharacterized protein n=1 Tax=Anopheles maculatus TaxID=74869 RepID=A0A182SJY0_9DIPT